MLPCSSSEIYLLVLCGYCSIASIETGDACGEKYKIPEWEPDDSPAPGFLRLGILGNRPGKDPAIGAQVTNRTENTSLTLYANPFILDGNCPNIRSNFSQLRKFHLEHEINVGGRENVTYFFAKAFTGCYYAQMTNAEGKKWIWSPTFFKTSYHYYDTMLKCKESEFVPEDSEKNKQLMYDLEIPQTCLKVKCELFELDKINNNTVNDLNSGKILASQTCWVINDNNTATSKCNRVDTNLTLTTDFIGVKGEGWTVVMTWNQLKKGSAHYYAKFSQYSHNCLMERGDLMTWISAVNFGALSYGLRDESNGSESRPYNFLDSKEFTIILYVVLALVIAAILIFWMSKLARIKVPGRLKMNEVYDENDKIINLNIANDSDDILLVYARDSSDNEFTETMEAFRGRLQHICKVKVHDVYSADDYSSVAQLGTESWVRDVLKAGCKVVWVDTPYFRSVVNIDESKPGMENEYPSEDFRDGAIPYTLSVATNLFQNATIQYRRHFVVRLKGWKVSDGPDDPLQVVSPHVRYSIPPHFVRLCEDLTKKKHREIENGRIYLAPV